MNIKRRIKFLVVELLTLTVVIAAAWVVLYPGGDRIAIKWLTGQEPAADSYVVRDLNPDSSLTQADPSPRELLRRERNAVAADHAMAIQPMTPGSASIAFTEDPNTTPRLEELTPDNVTIPSMTNGIPSSNSDRPAFQVGFVRTPEIKNDCEPAPIRSLPILSEPAKQSASDSRGTALQADTVKPLDEDLVVRLPAAAKEAEHSGHQIRPRRIEPTSTVKADSMTWKSEVSDEMVVENGDINSAAVEMDHVPASGRQRQTIGSDTRSESKSAKSDPRPNLDRGPIPANKTADPAENTNQGGDFVPPDWTARPLAPVAPVVPPARQLQRIEINGQNLVRGSKLPDLGSQNPLR